MVRSRFFRWIQLLSGGMAAAALLLRVVVLKTAYDSDGLVKPGSTALLWTVILLAAGLIALGFLCLRLNRLPGTNACFAEGDPWELCGILAAALLFSSCLLRLLTEFAKLDGLRRAVEFAGMAAAAGMAAVALRRTRLGKACFWLQVPLQLYLLGSLLLRFTEWSHDPMILDFAPMMLLLVSAAVASTLLPGFPLNAGHRRGAVYWGLVTGVLASMNLADQLLGRRDIPDLAMSVALALWFVIHALQLLRAPVQEEQPPADPPEEAPDEAPEDPSDSPEGPSDAPDAIDAALDALDGAAEMPSDAPDAPGIPQEPSDAR